MEQIEFRLKVIEDKLGIALDQNEKKAKSLGNTLQVALGTFASATVIKGISLVNDGFKSLAGFIGESVTAAAESEASIKRLEVALSQTGQLSEKNVKSFQAFATQIQATTSFEDDLVISNIALIQSLARLDSEGLKKATEAALNLSSALGIDLETASRIVGKAADGNTTALGKLGIEFRKGSTDAETFSNVLNSIQSRFGGAAQAQAQTFAGTIAQLSNIWGDLKENVGAAITQNPAVIAAFGVLRDIIISFSSSINEAFGQGNQDQIANLFRLTLDSINAVVLTLDALGRGFTATVEISLAAIRTLALGITTPIAGVLELLALIPGVGNAFKGAADAATAEMLRLSEALDKNLEGFSAALSGETFLSGISQQIADTKVNFDVLYNDIKTKQTDLKNNPVTIFDEEANQKQLESLALLRAASDEYFLAEQQRVLDAKLQAGIARQEDLEQFLFYEQQKIDSKYAAEIEKTQLIGDEQAKQTAIFAIETKKQQELDQKRTTEQAKFIQSRSEEEKRQLTIRNNYIQASANLASALFKNGSKEAFYIQKAAAAASIYIDDAKARTAAMASAQVAAIGLPIGAREAYIAASYAKSSALITSSTALAASAIAASALAGFANGGIIGSSSLATRGADDTMIRARNGEAVLTVDDQAELLRGIRSGALGGGNITIQIDGRNIAYAVRDQINQGFKLT